MNCKKTAVHDGIVTEMLSFLNGFGIDRITEVINEKDNNGHISEDLSKSIFVTTFQRPGANECEFPKIISLMSHINN